MFMKFLGDVGLQIRNIQLDFGVDQIWIQDQFSTLPSLRDRN